MDGQMLRRAGPAAAGPETGSSMISSPQPTHVLNRDDDLDVQLLGDAGVDDGDRPSPALGVTPKESGDLLERPLGGRQPDPLRWFVGQTLKPFQGDRHVGAPLGRG